jgi:hypothetical protein
MESAPEKQCGSANAGINPAFLHNGWRGSAPHSDRKNQIFVYTFEYQESGTAASGFGLHDPTKHLGVTCAMAWEAISGGFGSQLQTAERLG